MNHKKFDLFNLMGQPIFACLLASFFDFFFSFFLYDLIVIILMALIGLLKLHNIKFPFFVMKFLIKYHSTLYCCICFFPTADVHYFIPRQSKLICCVVSRFS